MKKRVLLALGGIAFIGGLFVSSLGAKDPILVSAEGEDSSVAAPEEEKTVADYYHTATQWIEDKIIPIFGGVTIASLGTAAVTFIATYIKVKGDKLLKSVVKEQGKEIGDLREEVKSLKESSQDTKQFVTTMFENFGTDLANYSTTMNSVAISANKIVDLVGKQNRSIIEVTGMKEAIEVSCDLIAKSLALSDAAVKSGIAEDAVRIANSLKGAKHEDQEG